MQAAARSGVVVLAASSGQPAESSGDERAGERRHAGTEGGRQDGADTSDIAATLGKSIDDSVITTKVKTGLLADGGSDISVETKNGVVTLTGAADSRQQVDRMLRTVRTVKGVRAVRNALSVKKQ